jgi:hypothetical protein
MTQSTAALPRSTISRFDPTRPSWFVPPVGV